MKKFLTILFAAAIALSLSLPMMAQDNDHDKDAHKDAKHHRHHHRKHHKKEDTRDDHHSSSVSELEMPSENRGHFLVAGKEAGRPDPEQRTIPFSTWYTEVQGSNLY